MKNYKHKFDGGILLAYNHHYIHAVSICNPIESCLTLSYFLSSVLQQNIK